MPFTPTARDRWLALALLLAVLALAYLLLVHPWFTAPLHATNQDIAALQERQQRIQAQLAQEPQLRERLQQVREELATRPGLLIEATAEGGAAALGVRLQDVVGAASPGNAGCAISNRTPLADHRMQDGFERVAMQVRLRCGVDEMALVLHALENGAPRLFVENLNLLAQRYHQAVQQESGTGLDVSFELVGYLQPAGSMTAPAADSVAQAPAAADAAAAMDTPADAPVAAETPPAAVPHALSADEGAALEQAPEASQEHADGH